MASLRESATDAKTGSLSGRMPYSVAIGKSYDDYQAALKNMLARVSAEANAGNGKPTEKDDAEMGFDDEAFSSLTELPPGMKDGGYADGLAAAAINTPSVGDCSIMGNDALNPYAGFCEDDDIIPAMYKGTNGVYGMGRVYREIYDDKQQLLYIQLGVPKFRNLSDFLSNAAVDEVAEVNDYGGHSGSLLGTLFSGIKLAITLPFLPLELAGKFIDGLDKTKITEYFYFHETMFLYYKYVNTFMSKIAVAMGLYWGDKASAGKDDSLPLVLKGGPDIFKILQTRSSRFGATPVSTDDAYKQYGKAEDEANRGMWHDLCTWVSSIFAKATEGFKDSVYDASRFICFKIEKGSDNASESFSNSVTDSQLQQRLNSIAYQKRERDLSVEGMGTGLRAGIKRTAAWVDNLAKQVKGIFDDGKMLKGIIDVTEYGSVGNGFYDLPRQWSGASFSRSTSISIRLRSKTGGDPYSIYQNIMVPLSCLLAMAMPRPSGNSTYTSPFIMRAWVRGMFNIPAGIVTSMTITRGESEFGWSRARLPTVVNVNMTIEDLSPILFMDFADSGFTDMLRIMENNTKLIEYVNTLTGLSVKHRYYKSRQILRNFKGKWLDVKNTTLSPVYWGEKLGNSSLGRLVNMFSSIDSMRVK